MQLLVSYEIFFSATSFEDLLMEMYAVFHGLSEEKINSVGLCYTDIHWAHALEQTHRSKVSIFLFRDFRGTRNQ